MALVFLGQLQTLSFSLAFHCSCKGKEASHIIPLFTSTTAAGLDAPQSVLACRLVSH